jgi:hypothetical protein
MRITRVTMISKFPQRLGRDQVKAPDPAVADRYCKSEYPSPRSAFPAYLLISLVGVGGFIAFLVCSHDHPALAMPLRILALAWFVGFGAFRMILVKRR